MLIPRIPIIHRLFTRLLISHILLVSIPLLITGRILVDTAQTAVERTIQERNLDLARRSSWLIHATIGRARDLLRLSAQSPTFYSSDRLGQELMINNLVNQFAIFKKISIFDTLGRELNSTAYGAPFGNLESNGALTQVLTRHSFTSEVYVSDEKLPLMDMAEPIIVFDDVTAILWAEVDLKAIWALVDSNVVGSQREAFIFRADGQFIAHSDRRKVLERQRFEEPEIIKDVINGGNGHKIYINKEKVEMIAAYAAIPDEKWGTVIQQTTNEAFAPSRNMRIQIFLITLISLLVAALIAALYTRQIVKPVDQLVAGISRIARGDLDYRLLRMGRDEISALALHFNAMTAKLRRFQKQLRRTERVETLNKLSAVLSHEIRNPLNAMVINMQLLRREFLKPEIDLQKLEHYHRILSSEIRRVDDLVSNFLLIARPPKLEKSSCRIAELLDNLIKAEVPEVLPKGIRVIRDYRIPDLMVNVDSNKIYQVFLNIFLNAVQAMPGGGRLTIHLNKFKKIKNNRERAYAIISFTDSGKGIRKEELPKIFDFYFSTKEGGSGIGLSIAQQIVEKHQGTIRVQSMAGKGSKFIVLLPIENPVSGNG